MGKLRVRAIAPGVILLLSALPFVPAALPDKASSDRPGWKLTWSDEFAGDQIDPQKWSFQTGGAGWGNHELEYYTDRPENAFVKEGMLHLVALKEDYHGSKYTSARLRTGGKGKAALFAQKYGRFEFRAKLPTGKGLWPAIWLLPQGEIYGAWAGSGEIDVVEERGDHPDIVQATLHYGQKWPKNIWSGQQFRLTPHSSVTDFHVYALEWEPGEIRVSVDDHVYFKRNFWFSKAADGSIDPWPAPFDQPLYILLNVAVGGDFGGGPNDATTFPQEMVVDYVRVYENINGSGPVKPRGPGDINAKSKVDKPAE